MKYFIPCIVLCAFLASAAPGRATTIDWVGTYTNWATSWTAINGLNDIADQGPNYSYDLVADASNPVAQYATNADYYMFRMQLAISDITSATAPLNAPNNSYFIIINLTDDGTNNSNPDYAITWDAASSSNSGAIANHGLEMQTAQTGATWGSTQFNDIDNNANIKGVTDFNYGTRTTDGYVRTVGNVVTGGSLGTVSYVDIAISKSYLNTYVSALYDGNTKDINDWNIQFATRAGGTDHLDLNGDIAGGESLSDPPDAFANVADAPVPEPGTFLLMGSGLLGLLGYRRKGSLLVLLRR